MLLGTKKDTSCKKWDLFTFQNDHRQEAAIRKHIFEKTNLDFTSFAIDFFSGHNVEKCIYEILANTAFIERENENNTI